MKLKCITCSGANEFTCIDDLFALHREFPCVEFGIQVSGKKCGFDSKRFAWLQDLKEQILISGINLNLALHLNQDWVDEFCDGNIVPELQELLSWKNAQGAPMFQRVQLNFKIGRNEITPIPTELEAQMMRFPHLRFILSYNAANALLIKEIYHRHNVIFDLLFDESFGEGIAPDCRQKPVFDDIVQGYAGGLSPENVAEELQKIALLSPKALIFIDAEGKLKGYNGHFSYAKARDFVASTVHTNFDWCEC